MVATRSWGQREKRHRLMGLEFQICKMKSSKDTFYNNVNILNDIDAYIETVHLYHLIVKWYFVLFTMIKKKSTKVLGLAHKAQCYLGDFLSYYSLPCIFHNKHTGIFIILQIHLLHSCCRVFTLVILPFPVFL